MKQVLQNLKTGETRVADVPIPSVGRDHVLIRTLQTVISAGTERMLVEFGQSSLIGKARAQPDKVRLVLDKMQTDGILPTLEAVFRKLDEPIPLGYCNVGEVVECGHGVDHLVPGDRVASNGGHAEYVVVSKMLCAKVPDEATNDQAAFTVLASIALQGVRLAEPTLGERVAVFGLGLIGLLTVQLLHASGCEVLGVDLNPDRCRLAEEMGARVVNPGSGGDPVRAAMAWTREVGVDAVLITASAKSDDIVHQAATMSRKRGRIVLVGVVGLNLRRADFYEKELTFQVSCSYGPGRYDERYEQQCQDYPLPFVRWTEQRNLEAVLRMFATGRLDVSKLVSHRVLLADAETVYGQLGTAGDGLATILECPKSAATEVVPSKPVSDASRVVGGVALVGVGSFANSSIAPALKKVGASLTYVVGRSNTASLDYIQRKFGFASATTDLDEALADPNTAGVVIATRPDSHVDLAVRCLDAGKHVLMEKPAALDEEQLESLLAAADRNPGLEIAVGFNRRHSRHLRWVKERIGQRAEPLTISYLVNAGHIPADSWIHDHDANGGRVIGEVCHFVDCCVYLTGSPVREVGAFAVDGTAVHEDRISIHLAHEDGSISSICYFANGPKRFPKETVHVFSDGSVYKVDNYRRTTAIGPKRTERLGTRSIDKGVETEMRQFAARCAGNASKMFGSDYETVTRATSAADRAWRTRTIVRVPG